MTLSVKHLSVLLTSPLFFPHDSWFISGNNVTPKVLFVNTISNKMGLHEEPTYLSKDDDLTGYSLYYFAKYFIQNQPDLMKTGVENYSYINLFSPTPP